MATTLALLVLRERLQKLSLPAANGFYKIKFKKKALRGCVLLQPVIP